MVGVRVGAHPRELAHQAPLNLGVFREEIQGPSDPRGNRLVTREDHRDGFVSDRRVSQRATVAFLPVSEEIEEVTSRGPTSPTLS